MTIPELIDSITFDRVAVFFYFMIIPVLVFLISLAGARSANDPPYNYVFSTLVYLVCIPGVLSATFWLYSMLFEQKSLWALDFSIYYLPLISMLISLYLISRQANISRLPWFGELYELLAMIGVVSGFIILIIHLQIIHFGHSWQVLLFFILLFGLLKLGWERLMRLTR